MATVAAPTPPKRRGGRRLLIAFVILLLIVVGVVVWLNVAASAQVNASATLTVYQPAASTSHNGTDFVAATTGAVILAGDSVQTDTKGRAAISLPDGTLTRLASDTTIRLDSAHFTKTGNLHDVTLSQKVGRTFTNVQHLASGATFDVKGHSATASAFSSVMLKSGWTSRARWTNSATAAYRDSRSTDGRSSRSGSASGGTRATADVGGRVGGPEMHAVALPMAVWRGAATHGVVVPAGARRH